jgi:hypothetical protein
MPLTVNLDTSDSARAALHRVVLASLPQRFVITRKRGADIAVVSVDGIGTAVAAGAKGILLVASTAVELPQIRDLAPGDAVIAVDTRFAADPTWAATLADIAPDARTASLIDSVVTVEELTERALFESLVDQLAVLRRLVGSFDRLGCIHRSSRQLALVGSASGVAVSLTAVASATLGSTLRVDVVSADRRWKAYFDDTALARPTEITLYDCHGARSRPLLYASGRRTAWIQLHAAITEKANVAYSLDDFATDLRIAQQALTYRTTA